MDKVYDNCCGIDVHKKVLVACFIRGRKQVMREFGATTSQLLVLSDWLLQGGCQMVAMESTASYWKPLYNILESAGIPAMVVNAQHMKAVPGRKTDVKDAQWIAQLLQHGLLKASYIPGRDQRELRELVSYRKSLVTIRTAEVNRFQKMLEGGNIKLSGTVANINGVSSRNLLEALLSGDVISLEKLEAMEADKQLHNLKASKEQLAEDLRGVLSPLQKKMLTELLAHVDELNEHIRRLEDDIRGNMGEEQKRAAAALEEVTGLGEQSANAVVAVIGTDMSRFPTDAHLASWAGLCPGNRESAGKKKSGKTTKGNKLLRTTLVICAHSAVQKKDSYFSAQFQRISAHRGKKRAYVAVAHSMLTAIYHILKDGVEYKDLGAEYYNQFNREQKINAYLKKLKALGWEGPNATAALAT